MLKTLTSLASAAAALSLITLTTGAFAATRAGAELLPRMKIVLPSALAVDLTSQSVTLPLHRGRSSGQTVWYIVTDSSDAADAKRRAALYAPKLAEIEATCNACIAHVRTNANEIEFDAAPDFSPAREYVPGPTGFPPSRAAPGSTASAAYSPFIRIDASTVVINAPIIATGDVPFDLEKHTNTHDRVLAIDTTKMTVTLLLAHGFANGQEILYISTDASDPVVATVERATFVPSLKGASEGTIPVFAVANGPRGSSGAQPQGLVYAAFEGNLSRDATLGNARTLHASLNVFGSFPTGADAGSYTPFWAVSLGIWNPAAVGSGANPALTSPRDFTEAAGRGALGGPDGTSFGPIGVNVNCPVIAYLNGTP